ncbi:MAG: TRAP transporter substrate-binding protein [Deltaproteobacteria bacterium]|nr:TRAP transporter substrate-binding protein [Deltaproteobacteria bacterium]
MKRLCNKIYTVVALTFGLTLIFTGTVIAAEYTIRLHYEMPTTAPLAVYGFEPWAKDVEKVTNGRVKVQTFPGDTLFKTKTDAVEAIKAGIADIGFMYAWAFAPQFDLTDVLSVPFVAPNAEVASRATWRIYQKFPEVQKQWKGVKLLAVWTTDPYIFITRDKQIKTMEDFAGMKMRMTGGMATKMMKLLGGTPMTIPMPQNYENLQKGVIDGMAAPAEAILGFRLYEVVKYYTLVPTTLVTQEMIMNLNSWNRLPKDIQEAIMRLCGDHAAIRFGGGCFDRAWTILPKRVKEANRPMITYTPPQEEIDRWIEKAGKPLWGEWVDTMVSRGYKNAAEIQQEAIRLVKEISRGKKDNWKEMFPFPE